MENRANTALVALRRILRTTELHARQLARQSELTTSQLLLLKYVARARAALASTIAREIDLKQATVTVLVNKLETAGLVTRRRDTEDRRRIWIELTELGMDAIRESPDLLQDRFEQSFDGLAPWEQALIVAILERVATMLDAEELDAAPVLDVGDLDRVIAAQPASGKG